MVRWCAWSIGVLLACTVSVQSAAIAIPANSPSASGSSIFSLQEQRHHNAEVVLRQLATATVVYLGETHDSAADHQAQLEIIQALHQRNSKLAIGLEMFQRPYQPALDRYLAGELTEDQLREQSQFDTRWGFPWEYYAPILRFAKANRLPLLALNTPTEITRKVARGGLASLTPAEQQFIPPASDIQTDNQAYRQRLLKIYQESHGGHGSSQNFERFFLAQVLWDETMAEEISQFLQANPTTQVVVLAGQVHLVYGDGIPSRVARRLKTSGNQRRNFSQRLILLNPSEDLPQDDRTVADYFWYSR